MYEMAVGAWLFMKHGNGAFVFRNGFWVWVWVPAFFSIGHGGEASAATPSCLMLATNGYNHEL